METELRDKQRLQLTPIIAGFCAVIWLLLFSFQVLYSQNESTAPDSWVILEKELHTDFPLENLRYYPLKRLKVALVLSGGGARGFAHIGVLKAFEEHNIPVNLIVGSSIGSVIGGFYAAGFSADEIRQKVLDIDWNSMFNDEAYRPNLFLSQKTIPRRHLLQFRLDGVVPIIPSSISQGQKIFQTLYTQLLGANFQAASGFDNLKIPFRAVATDLISGEKVVLDRGDLAEAINASLSFPLLFAPVEIDGRLLVDGGITDNLPVDVALQNGANLVIAVDATSPLRQPQEIAAPWEIADQVTTIMMKTPTEESRQMADLVIKPALKEVKGSNFENADSLIRVGYLAAVSMMDSLKTLLHAAQTERYGENAYLGRLGSLDFKGADIHSLLPGYPGPQLQVGQAVYRRDLLHELRLMYQSGVLEDVQALIHGPADRRRVVFQLSPQPLIDQVVFHQTDAIADSLLESLQELLVRRRLNIKELFAELNIIRDQMVADGYSLAQVETIRFDPQDRSLHIFFNPGYIDDVQITGNRVTRNFVIMREFPLRPDSLFRAKAVLDGIRNIYSTNLFDRVLINLERSGDKNNLIIKVKERKYSLTRLGAHVSSERKPEAFVELVGENFAGTAVQANIWGVLGDFTKKTELSFSTVRLFRTYLTTRLNFYYREREDRYYRHFVRQDNYRILRRGGQFLVGQQIERLGLISAEFRVENIDVQSADPEIGSQEGVNLRAFTLRSVVDKRDKLPFPDRGVFNRWYWETGNQQEGDTKRVPFTRLFLGLEGYYPFYTRFNYRPYLYVGTADETLPFSEFFAFGGQENFPGLFEREKFGRQFLQTGVDIRYQVKWDLPVEAYFYLKYSVGAAWERPEAKIEWEDFLHSVSASFAVNTLLGPIKLSYARIVKHRWQFNLSFGFDF